jgi:thiol-disulfide isomerase/thioredoxin
MRPAIFVIVLAGVLAGPPTMAANGSVEARLVDGSNFSSAHGDIAKPLLFKFWATWCVACLQEMPAYIESFEKHGENIQFLAVDVAVSDPLDRVIESVEEFALEMPVAYDSNGKLWDRFGVFGTPTYVLLGRDGEILYRSYGHSEELEAVLDQVSSSADRSPAVTELGGLRSSTDTILDIDGHVVDLENSGGDITVSYHFAVWCASYVEDSYPELSRRCRDFDERVRTLEARELPGARLIGFATAYSTDEASVVRYRDSRKIEYPLVFDSNNAYAKMFGTRSFPHVTVVAQDGKVVYSGNQIPTDINQIISDAAGR